MGVVVRLQEDACKTQTLKIYIYRETPGGITWGNVLQRATMAVLMHRRLLMSPRSKDLAAFIRRWQPEIGKSTCSYFSFVRSVVVFRFLKRKKMGVYFATALSSGWQRCGPTVLHFMFFYLFMTPFFSHLDAALWCGDVMLISALF